MHPAPRRLPAIAWAAALLAALAVVAVTAPSAMGAGDPARRALARGDAYVSPTTLGPASLAARHELAVAAKELAADSRPVKLAIVRGPAGSRSMLAYARRLVHDLGYDGTLVVTAPGRPVGVAGPLPQAEITRRLRKARVGRIANPVDRVVAAARVGAAVRPRPEQKGTRAVLVLLALAGLGGVWAVALGMRREGRRQRDELLERRAAMRVRLDALRARAVALARRDDLPPEARARVDAALGAYAEAVSGLQEVRRREALQEPERRLRDGLDAVAEAAAAVGEAQPADDPFAGLCGVDPAHGPATAQAPTAGHPEPVPVCGGCREAVDRGDLPAPRLIPVRGRPVPFTAAAAEVPEASTGGR